MSPAMKMSMTEKILKTAFTELSNIKSNDINKNPFPRRDKKILNKNEDDKIYKN